MVILACKKLNDSIKNRLLLYLSVESPKQPYAPSFKESLAVP
jgi:hypothetical protein